MNPKLLKAIQSRHWSTLSDGLSRDGGLYKSQVTECLRRARDTMPDDVKYYLADVIDGKAKWLEGSPRARNAAAWKLLQMRWWVPPVYRYFRYLRHHCGMKYSDAKEQTCEKFAARKDVSARFIEDVFREYHIK